MKRGIAYALGAAILFGLSTPLAKSFVGQIHPVMLAGLLYAGSGIGLAMVLAIRSGTHRNETIAWPRGADLGWLAAAIGFGGVAAPIFLMSGLALTQASTASLLLNLEAVFTAVAAWVVFRENVSRAIVGGMALIVAGGVILSWESPAVDGFTPGAALIAAACLCWAADNNLTRKISANDAVVVAGLKGLVAGAVNLAASVMIGAAFPSVPAIAGAAAIGFLGYGVSLALFVLALRELGTARTGAYFSVGPFFGAALAILLHGEPLTLQLAIAAILMGAGTWLHVHEHHAHEHTHERMTHTHAHVHDEHHQHGHAKGEDVAEPHVHEHTHEPIRHRHPHYPDIHHRHGHGAE